MLYSDAILFKASEMCRSWSWNPLRNAGDMSLYKSLGHGYSVGSIASPFCCSWCRECCHLHELIQPKVLYTHLRYADELWLNWSWMRRDCCLLRLFCWFEVEETEHQSLVNHHKTIIHRGHYHHTRSLHLDCTQRCKIITFSYHIFEIVLVPLSNELYLVSLSLNWGYNLPSQYSYIQVTSCTP